MHRVPSQGQSEAGGNVLSRSGSPGPGCYEPRPSEQSWPQVFALPHTAFCQSLLQKSPDPSGHTGAREKVKGEGAGAKGARQGCGDGLQGAKGSPFPACPHAPGKTPSGGPHAEAGKHLGSPLETEGPWGTLGGSSRTQDCGRAVAAASSVLGRAEFELLLERSERHFPWGWKRAQLQTLYKQDGSCLRVGEFCWVVINWQG